jgi:hypothetical protein
VIHTKNQITYTSNLNIIALKVREGLNHAVNGANKRKMDQERHFKSGVRNPSSVEESDKQARQTGVLERENFANFLLNVVLYT